MHRRSFTLAAAGALPTLALGTLPTSGRRRFVLVVLRGGMDGLMAAPVPGDPAFAEARGALGRFESAPLALDGPYALHPLLPRLHAMYGAGEFALVHASGLAYRERSHFDAQQLLESGGTVPHALSTGWLGRALAAVGGRAVALETAVPLALRGAEGVDTWAPSLLPEPSADLVARLEAVYRDDPALAAALRRARALRPPPADGVAAGRGFAVGLARQAAAFLQQGLQVAMLELNGWDSHANQAAPQGAAANALRTLDAVAGALRDGLQAGEAWRDTVVLAATEFGRTVAINGTQGTDHGSGGAAFVFGGAVRGGRVVADWPGLATAQRFEGRDLRVTTDLRAVQRAILADHLGVSKAALDSNVLPGTATLPRIDLLRA